jgi:hypothetical protein
MLSVAICIYLLWGFRMKDSVYTAVFIWVCAAIIVKQSVIINILKIN